MLAERPQLPTRERLKSIRIIELSAKIAKVELVDAEVEFSLPVELLPLSVAEGDRLSLKILDPAAEEESHTIFAQKLLTEIMN